MNLESRPSPTNFEDVLSHDYDVVDTVGESLFQVIETGWNHFINARTAGSIWSEAIFQFTQVNRSHGEYLHLHSLVLEKYYCHTSEVRDIKDGRA